MTRVCVGGEEGWGRGVLNEDVINREDYTKVIWQRFICCQLSSLCDCVLVFQCDNLLFFLDLHWKIGSLITRIREKGGYVGKVRGARGNTLRVPLC